MIDNPKPNQICKGKEIGKNNNNNYIWAECVDCHKPRWTSTLKGQPIAKRCWGCFSKYRMEHARTKSAGQQKAHKMHPILGKCQLCDKDAYDIHHIDGNDLNNALSNHMLLCRYHHMKIDGRLKKLNTVGSIIRSKNANHTCINCGGYTDVTRKGRCHSCSEYYRRHGFDKKISNKIGHVSIICKECGTIFESLRIGKIYCPRCKPIVSARKHAQTEKRRRDRINSAKHGIYEK